MQSAGETGLIGFAFDSDFELTRFVYLLYLATRSGQPAVNQVVRYTEANNTAGCGQPFSEDDRVIRFVPAG